MPDTTLLHLITGHTVRTTSSVDAVLAALKPTALPDHGLTSSQTRTATSCTSARSM